MRNGADYKIVFTVAQRSEQAEPAIPLWLDPIVAKVGGLRSQGVKGEAVVNLLRALDNAG